jgi:hypothetical protein
VIVYQTGTNPKLSPEELETKIKFRKQLPEGTEFGEIALI